MMDSWLYKRAFWEECWALWPRRCDLSGQWIWGKHNRGTVTITGPGDPVVYRIWHHRHQHLMYKLKEVK